MLRSLIITACLLFAAMSPARAQELTLPWQYGQFMDAARTAEAIEDPLQRCLAYPDLPGNQWSPGMARKVCLLFDTPSPISLDAIDAMLRSRDGVNQLDALYRKELDANFDGERDRVFRAFTAFNACCIEKAEPIARKWLAAAPDSPYAQTALGLVLADRGWNARGKAVARETPASNFVQMQAFFDSALVQLEAALKTEPRLLPACSEMIMMGAQTGRALQARGSSLCLEADPASFFVVARMADAAEPKWGGSPAQMRAVADYARSQMRANPMLELLSVAPDGESMGALDDPDVMIATFEPVGLRVPNPNYLRLAGSGFNLKESDGLSLMKALHWLSEYLRFYPSDAWALRQRAQLMDRFEDRQWATRDAERAVLFDPNNMWLRTYLGGLLQRQGRHAEALPHLRVAMDDPKQHEVATVLHCRATVALERWSEARACSEVLTREQPEDSESWLLRLKALQRYDAPGADVAMRRFLQTQRPISERYPDNARVLQEVHAWMAAHAITE